MLLLLLVVEVTEVLVEDSLEHQVRADEQQTPAWTVSGVWGRAGVWAQPCTHFLGLPGARGTGLGARGAWGPGGLG